jgi:hypothetical protein
MTKRNLKTKVKEKVGTPLADNLNKVPSKSNKGRYFDVGGS